MASAQAWYALLHGEDAEVDPKHVVDLFGVDGGNADRDGRFGHAPIGRRELHRGLRGGCLVAIVASFVGWFVIGWFVRSSSPISLF